MGMRVVFFAVILLSANVGSLLAEKVAKDTGSTDAKQAELDALKAEFEALLEKLGRAVNAAPAETPAAKEAEEPEEIEVDVELDEFEEDKRCPNGCGDKKNKEARECEKRCPGCKECKEMKEDSSIMKRFLSALPVEKQLLVQHNPSKKTYIERILRRGVSAQKADTAVRDVAEHPAKSAVRSSVQSIGVRALPAEDSSLMSAFRRSLNPQQQQLLKNHNSKTRFIEALLKKRAVQDARDVDKVHAKRQSSDPEVQAYIATLSDSQKQALQNHPAAIPKLKEAIQKGPSVDPDQKKKRDEAVDDVLSQLSPEDKALLQAHISQLQHLKVAQSRPVGNPEERSLGEEAMVSRLMHEIQSAKKRGISVAKLLEAVKKRAVSSKKGTDKRKPAASKKHN